MRLRSLSLAVLPVLLGIAPAQAAERWQSYDNARYGYRICYPADRLTAQPEADAGDGRVFSGKSGAELRVWGSFNALEEDTKQLAHRNEEDVREGGGAVTYEVVKPGFSVVSGQMGDTIYYAKNVLQSDRVVSFTLKYPAAEASRWTAVVEKLAGCLTLGTLPQ